MSGRTIFSTRHCTLSAHAAARARQRGVRKWVSDREHLGRNWHQILKNLKYDRGLKSKEAVYRVLQKSTSTDNAQKKSQYFELPPKLVENAGAFEQRKQMLTQHGERWLKLNLLKVPCQEVRDLSSRHLLNGSAENGLSILEAMLLEGTGEASFFDLLLSDAKNKIAAFRIAYDQVLTQVQADHRRAMLDFGEP